MYLTFLKLGGSLITDKTRESAARIENIRLAARAIKRAIELRPDLSLLIGHGSGSFGHFAARKSGFGQRGNWSAFAETGAVAAQLNRIITAPLIAEGIPVVSLQPSASALARDGELIRLADQNIRTALEHRLVPLVYGDVSFDETRDMTIASTEKIFAYLARLLMPQRIVLAGEVAGVFTADPLRDPNASLISELTTETFAAMGANVGLSHGADVTGGMNDKVTRMLALVQQHPSLEVYIVGVNGIVEALTQDKPRAGTRIVNQAATSSG
jgi:isopentenyl phosphate kinase